jgi:tetratricopeptide (TPR) repeat protein
VDAYRDLLEHDPSVIAARNNLALALAEQGEYDAALREIGIALSENRDAAVESELRDTEATIRGGKAGAD